MDSSISRRFLLTRGAATLLAGGASQLEFARAAAYSSPAIGYNLVAWDVEANTNPAVWNDAVRRIAALGVRGVTIVPYHFVDGQTGEVRAESIHGHVSGPDAATVSEVIATARRLRMDVALKPLIEIDTSRDLAENWRGNVDFDGNALEGFFISYAAYLHAMASIAAAHEIQRFYIGSELAALTRNQAAQQHWLDLIAGVRNLFPKSVGQLSYAANFDEFNQVPFWQQLDEIGIDAYFPLATSDEALGVGRPSAAIMIPTWHRHFDRLRHFARSHGKAIRFAEFGIVPRDLASLDPWNWREPKRGTVAVADAEEQYNAIAALLAAVRSEDDWLVGIDFWHWQVSELEDSLYNIGSTSSVARLIADFIVARTEAER